MHGKCVCVTERDSVGDALIGCLNRRDLSYEDDITLNTQIHADDINSGSLLVAGVGLTLIGLGSPQDELLLSHLKSSTQ